MGAEGRGFESLRPDHPHPIPTIDAEGRRVAKGSITSFVCDPTTNGFSAAVNETDYVLDQDGHQVTTVFPLTGLPPAVLPLTGLFVKFPPLTQSNES